MRMISLEDAVKVLEEEIMGCECTSCNSYNEGIKDAIAVLRSIPSVDGVMVPREPTPAMCAAGFAVDEAEHDPAGVYRAMIDAAPKGEA